MRHIHLSIPITDPSSVGEARRTAVHAADKLGLGQDRRNDVGIAVTEAANNVLLHAGKGELLICPFAQDDSRWIDLLAIDSGPGIRDISRAMEDGFSTIGTAGQGLGAIQRLSDDSSFYSVPEQGTVYWFRFGTGSASAAASVGLVNVPLRGESTCGDSYLVLPGRAQSVYMVVDGLGHGAGAAEAAEEAVSVVRQHVDRGCAEIISRTHDALKKTRGAAMSIAIADHEKRILRYGGIGNVSAALVTGTSSRSLVSQNGTLGAVLPRVTSEYAYPFERNTTLLMFSDGLSTKTGLGGYKTLQTRHPALVAGLLYRDFTRRRDDATLMVVPVGGG